MNKPGKPGFLLSGVLWNTVIGNQSDYVRRVVKLSVIGKSTNENVAPDVVRSVNSCWILSELRGGK